MGGPCHGICVKFKGQLESVPLPPCESEDPTWATGTGSKYLILLSTILPALNMSKILCRLKKK